MLQNQRFDNVAAAAQQHLEEIMKKWIDNAVQKTGIRKIVCAGSIFLNVKMNMILKKYLQELPSYNNDQKAQIFVYPAPDDSGFPVGCALEGINIVKEKELVQYMFQSTELITDRLIIMMSTGIFLMMLGAIAGMVYRKKKSLEGDLLTLHEEA